MAYTTIDDPSAHFQVKLYSGNSTQTSITYDGTSNLQPDLIWAKSRSNAHYHDWRDTSRGLTKRLTSNESNAEDTKSASYVSFDSNGFTLGDDQQSGSNANTVNSSSNNYVSWGWKANGGTTSSNSDGSITSTVQANTTAGFSIVTYTGTGSAGSFGHGLTSPKIIIIKDRDDSNGWYFHTTTIDGSDDYLYLNTTVAKANAGAGYSIGTSVYNLGGGGSVTNLSGTNYVAYCFQEIKGYSKFGSYTGNGNADGPFVYTGFRPAWIMVKRTDSANNWNIVDAKRDSINVMSKYVNAQSSDAEASYNLFDFTSNGFKIRNTGSSHNTGNIIYMAFAEHPFVSSKGVPVTAR